MYCFTKAQRLLAKQDYDAVFSHSKRIKTTHFIFLFKENSMGVARLGLALSKKIIHKAHDRNRTKRLLREMFRLNTNLIPMDIVVLARSAINWNDRSMVVTQLSNVWNDLSKK